MIIKTPDFDNLVAYKDPVKLGIHTPHLADGIGEIENNECLIKIPRNCSLISIKEIKIPKRVRKDFGDIETLAKTIRQIGLEEPIVITPKKVLLAGGRRIKAFELLGLSLIPFVFLDVDDLLQAEFIENSARKNFTTSETAEIIERIEKTKTVGRPPKKKGAKLAPFPPGKTADLVSQITGKSPAQIKKIKKIAKQAKTNPRYKDFMDDIDKGKKSVETVHTLVTIKERNLPKLAAPKGKYDLLSIDWPYKFQNKTIRGAALRHYPLMTLDEICNTKLPIGDEAVVGMWIPNSMKYDKIKRKTGQEEVIVRAGIVNHVMQHRTIKKDVYITQSTMQHILDAHNLEVGTEFIWLKNKPAPGSYSLGCHETFLICFRGKKIVPVKRFRSVIAAPVGKHSEKPKLFNRQLLEMYPNRKALEMYARDPTPGFAAYGNQAKKEKTICSICKRYALAKNKKTLAKEFKTKKEMHKHLVEVHEGTKLPYPDHVYFEKVKS